MQFVIVVQKDNVLALSVVQCPIRCSRDPALSPTFRNANPGVGFLVRLQDTRRLLIARVIVRYAKLPIPVLLLDHGIKAPA